MDSVPKEEWTFGMKFSFSLLSFTRSQFKMNLHWGHGSSRVRQRGVKGSKTRWTFPLTSGWTDTTTVSLIPTTDMCSTVGPTVFVVSFTPTLRSEVDSGPIVSVPTITNGVTSLLLGQPG